MCQERPFVHNFVCVFCNFWRFVRNFGRVFAILFEALQIEIQKEIHYVAGWEGGGLRGAKIVNKNFVNKLAFPPIFVKARSLQCGFGPRNSRILI